MIRRNLSLCLALLFFAHSAWAWNEHPKPPPPTTTGSNSNASSSQSETQTQSQSSKTSVEIESTGGSAAGGNASATVGSSTAVTGSSSSGGNYQGVDYSSPQQAPAVVQGSFAIQGCAAAGNAGVSNVHGAAFLGFAFTPAECYLFLQAQAYQAIGMAEAACQVLNQTRTMHRLVGTGFKPPTCVHDVPKPTERTVTQFVPVPYAVPVPTAKETDHAAEPKPAPQRDFKHRRSAKRCRITLSSERRRCEVASDDSQYRESDLLDRVSAESPYGIIGSAAILTRQDWQAP